jgi:hypothetical protein
MIEIGKSKTIKVRTKKHGKLVFKTDADGNPETKVVCAEVVRCTRGELDGHYGRDRGRKLVVRLKAGDVIEIWPMGTRQRYTAEIKSVFSWMLRNAANKAQLEKARERKVKVEQRRSVRRQEARDRRFREGCRAQTLKSLAGQEIKSLGQA